jgi:hypothetical protein
VTSCFTTYLIQASKSANQIYQFIFINLLIMKIMCLKSAFFIASSFILCMSLSQPANSEPTKWEDAKTSMSALLDNGWQIVGHGATRVAANGIGGTSAFDQNFFTFILTNGRKYMFCISENPRPPIANASSCRKLH